MPRYETIEYELIKKEGPIEIRKYDAILLASAKSNLNPKMDSGFSKVFRYIAGDNDQNKKISMTIPVVNYTEGDQLVTGFYVPKKFSKTSAPKPLGEVYLNELDESYYAAIRFKGSWKESNFNKHDALLKSYLNNHAIEIVSSRIILRYNPPFLPAFLRHNEIVYQIKYDKV